MPGGGGEKIKAQNSEHLRLLECGILHYAKHKEVKREQPTLTVLRRKTAPKPGSHIFFQQKLQYTIIFKLSPDLIKTQCFNVLSNFKLIRGGIGTISDHKANVETHIDNKTHKKGDHKSSSCCAQKTAPLPGSHVFSLIRTIFKLVRDIHITNVLTKFHDDKAKHMTSRVKKTPPPGCHVFYQSKSLSNSTALSRCEINGRETNVLTKFHED
ncbi:hypothetical protein DPMN_111259 [Dreissena polymorpha]|uniref:Uncharacterized protein n=1 Tax=Dreissena polymorpha TaxID=45954 RepID=A0A9D4QPL9_DREPO|nr:hypothetical protein DPMN_111259 [Dreissena polymorpha]